MPVQDGLTLKQLEARAVAKASSVFDLWFRFTEVSPATTFADEVSGGLLTDGGVVYGVAFAPELNPTGTAWVVGNGFNAHPNIGIDDFIIFYHGITQSATYTTNARLSIGNAAPYMWIDPQYFDMDGTAHLVDAASWPGTGKEVMAVGCRRGGVMEFYRGVDGAPVLQVATTTVAALDKSDNDYAIKFNGNGANDRATYQGGVIHYPNGGTPSQAQIESWFSAMRDNALLGFKTPPLEMIYHAR